MAIHSALDSPDTQTKYYLEQIVSERTDEIAEQKTLIEQQAEALSDSLENKVRFFTHASHELRTL